MDATTTLTIFNTVEGNLTEVLTSALPTILVIGISVFLAWLVYRWLKRGAKGR